jgi:hypothetical protein
VFFIGSFFRIPTLTLTLIRKFAFGIIGAFVMGMMNEVIVHGRRTVQKDLIAYKQRQPPGKVAPSQQQQRKDDLTTTVALKLFMTFLYTLQVFYFLYLIGPFIYFLFLGLIIDPLLFLVCLLYFVGAVLFMSDRPFLC